MAEGRRSSQRYLSGRSKIIGFSGLSTDRHLYVESGQVEPNLGFPGEKSLPVSSTYYKLITVPNGSTYDRYWQEDTPATLVNGISIFDEGVLVGTANTVSKLNFVGAAVTATASGTISTITVTPVSISTLAPPNPRSGDLWWDSDEGELNVYYQDINSAQWVIANSGIGTTAGGGGGGGAGGANVTVSSNPPGSASNGDLWWDSDIGELYIYYTDGDSNQWVETSGGSETVTISDNPPSSPNSGDLWWESDTGSLKIYYDDGDSQQWVDSNAGVLSSLSAFNYWQQNSAGINTSSNVGIGTTNVSAVDSNNTAVLAVGIVTANKYYGDGSNLTGISGGGGASVTVSTGAPSSPNSGDLWWDSDDADLLVYFNDGNSSQWVSTNAGATGAQGHQGATGGAQGAVGATGAQGAQGATGVGAQGATGGAQGAVGAQGAQGAQGASGTNGAQGASGTNGAQGATGSGSTGAQGAQGHQGASGTNGAQGASGTNGAQGAVGAQGATGSGSTGAQGATGSGAQGATGAQGAQGNSGSSGSRTTATASTGSIANAASANISITAAKVYALLKVQTSAAAWVTLYTDSTSRSNDASRAETTDPIPGSGVIAEVITSGAATQIMTPGVIGWNNDGTPASTVYAKVVNKSGSTQSIGVTLHYLALES